MTEELEAKECVFCAIVAGRAEASMVFEDETVAVWGSPSRSRLANARRHCVTATRK